MFVTSLTILLFLFNGDLTVINMMVGWLSQYQGDIAQSLTYVAILGFGIVAAKSEGYSLRKIGISKRQFGESLPAFMALALGTAAVAIYSGDWTLLTEQLSVGTLAVLIATVGFAAFVEEFIFRGYVQNGTTRRFGVAAGIAVSGLVFALAHIPVDLGSLDLGSGLLPVAASLAYSAFGRLFFGVVGFALVYYLTNNLFITFLTHSFYDFSVLYLAPPDGSIGYRLLFLGATYAAIIVMYGRKGFPSAIKTLPARA